jgi:hypothetical protein
MNKEYLQNIYNDAYDIAIFILTDRLKNKSIVPKVSEGYLMDKKYKSGLIKGINLAIDEIKKLKHE